MIRTIENYATKNKWECPERDEFDKLEEWLDAVIEWNEREARAMSLICGEY